MIIIDLGTSKYYLLNRDWFSNYIEVANKSIIVANSQKIAITEIGNNNYKLLIININYILEIKTSLLSLYKLANKG